MIDLHTHSLLSDGALIPSEHVRRLEVLGYSAVAITDHADSSNLDFLIPRIVNVAKELNESQSLMVIPGIEITHVPPKKIGDFVLRSRELGAELVIVHGETISEPVAPGTNRAGLESGADILAHPGLITYEESELAANNNILLEISSRAGHSLTNGHVVKMAELAGAKLILNSDAHTPNDFLTFEYAIKVVEGAGLSSDSFSKLLSNARSLIKRKGFLLMLLN